MVVTAIRRSRTFEHAAAGARRSASGRIKTAINGARCRVELYRSPDGRSLRTFLPRFLGLA